MAKSDVKTDVKKKAPKPAVKAAPESKPTSEVKQAAKAKAPQEPSGPARLKDHYDTKVAPALMKEFSYKNPMEVPRLERIVLNVGMGEATQNAKLLDAAVKELGVITGQRPVVTRAKKAIANFKLRKGLPVGAKVTLRGRHMYEFLDRLVTVALPRIRDFKGVSPKAFDGRGNYTLGLKEQLIFPEIKYDEVASIHGMDITVVSTAKTNDEGKALLKHMGIPFRV
jgi:large subunit ribosomal protein L5